MILWWTRRPGKLLILMGLRDSVIESIDTPPFELGIQFFLNDAYHGCIVRGHHGEGIPAACCPTGSADAVDVSLGGVRYVVIHDM